MIELYLASFLEPENFGKGRIIGIAWGKKPPKIETSSTFKPFVPEQEIYFRYRNEKYEDAFSAGINFTNAYKKQLTDFLDELEKTATIEECSIIDLLPFEDGDTLCSFERGKNTNYRKILCFFLEKIGYKVVLN